MKCIPLQQLMVTFSLLTPLLLQTQDFAYVGNREDGTVSVIRLTDDSVRATITVGEQPFNIAITPNLLFAYVVNLGSANVSKINTLTRTVVTTIPLAGFPHEIAITPDGTLAYVTDNLNSYVYKIDLSTDTVITTLVSGFNKPDGIAVNDAGTTVFVMNELAPPSYIDVATDAVSAGAPHLTNCNDIFIDPSGNEGYLTRYDVGEVAVAAVSTTLTFQTHFAVDHPEGISFTPNGGSYFGYVVSSSDQVVKKFNLTTYALVANISVDLPPFGIANDSENFYAYVTASSSMTGVGVVNKIDLSNNTIVGTITVGAGAQAIVILGDVPLTTPSNFQGIQFRDDAGVQYSLINRLSWDPVIHSRLTGYNIFRNGALIATVSPTTLTYEEPFIEKGITTQYSITSLGLDIESTPSTVTVP